MRPSREIATIGEAQPVRRVPGGSGTTAWTGAGLPAATGFAVHRDATNPIASAASATTAVATQSKRERSPRRDGCRRNARRRLDPCVADVAQPLFRVAFEASAEERANLGRRVRRQLRPVRLLPQHRGEHVRDGLALEAARARQHLVQDDAEGPDVGSLVDRPSARLLRRHVRRCTEHHAGLRRRGGDGG